MKELSSRVLINHNLIDYLDLNFSKHNIGRWRKDLDEKRD